MRRPVSLAMAVTLCLWSAAFATPGPKSGAFVDAPVGTLATRRIGHLHLSGDPSSTDVAAMKSAGFRAVIDIRQSSEANRASLEAAAKAAGIAYHNVPLFDAAGAIDAKAVAAISALHEKNEGVPHLVSCKSGNRSSAWYAAHVAKTQGLDSDKVIALARQAYLRDDMAAAVKSYLTKSVKPAP